MHSFNVIVGNFNSGKFEAYDVIPYLVSRYNEARKRPRTIEEFKEFIEEEAAYHWWGRCEYEILLFPWPYKANEEGLIEDFKQAKKIDIYQQLMMNIDVVTKILMDVVNGKRKRVREE